MKYISLRNMEVEIISMTANILNGDSSYVGSVTSGGSESILLAIKAYRDYFLSKNPNGTPELVLCKTAHPAFNKASTVFRVKLVYVDCDPETKLMRIDQV
jgi:sphinganine-1-phosphate aldolase